MALRITDELYSSTVEGVIADSSTIRGSYITVETITERDNLNIKALKNGQPVYVSEKNLTYRWDNKNLNWIEDNTLSLTVAEHISNTNNPHNVTAEQLGLGNVDNTADIDKPISTEVQNALNNIVDSVSALQTNLDTKLEASGIQALVGSLTIVKEGEFSGDLVVQGDLIVNGTTTTINHKNLEVENNLIVINSNGNSLGENLNGLVIKTSRDSAYGISYNNGNIEVGSGTIDENNLFSFNTNENYPILLRDQDNNIIDNHLLIWDGENNKAVDGGEIPTLEKLNGVSNDNFINLQNDVLLISNELEETNENLTSLQSQINNNIVNIENINNNLVYKLNTIPGGLNTVSDTVVGAINELKNSIEISEANLKESISNHAININNPHKVSLDQILPVRGSAFNASFDTNISSIKMNGNAFLGSLNTVARADHIHPTDTSRAPLTHVTERATNLTYGHVIVDDTISSTSTNPIQNKAVYDYVKESISNIKGEDVGVIVIPNSNVVGDSSKTITKLQQQDGAITIELGNIFIEQSQVKNLKSDLSDISSALINEIDERKKLIEEIKEDLLNEIIERKYQDASVLSNAQTYTNIQITELIENYNLDLLKNLSLDKSKEYLISYSDETSKWEITENTEQ